METAQNDQESCAQESYVQLEISTDKLKQLISQGKLCANDFHCLNSHSKEQIWQICLLFCAHSSNAINTKESFRFIL